MKGTPAAPTREVNDRLRAIGFTKLDMAKAIGRSLGTIRNVLNGSSDQRLTQQAICDFLRAEIWPGVKPRLECAAFKLPAGTRIVMSDANVAELLASLFVRGSVECRFSEIVIQKPVIVRLPFASPT